MSNDSPPVDRFEFAFDARARRVLLPLGVTPETTGVVVTESAVRIRYGPWRAEVQRRDIRSATATGPFNWIKAIGPRLSLADRGATLGTNGKAGVCLLLDRPSPLLLPAALLKHPGITVTVARPRELVALLDPGTSRPD